MSDELLPDEIPRYLDSCITVDEGWPPYYDIALPVIGLVFAAFCVWLGVRIINRGARPSRKILASLTLLAMFLAYPLSMGPVYWLTDYLPEWMVDPLDWFYFPLVKSPEPLHSVLNWYVHWN